MRSRALLRRVALLVLMVTMLAPLLLLIVTSLSRAWFFPVAWPQSLSVDAWVSQFSDATQRSALRNSLTLGLATGVLSTLVALPLGRAAAMSTATARRGVALLAFVAVAMPPVALGVGLQLTTLSLGIGGSLPGVLFAHLVPAVGYLTLIFLGVFQSWDVRLEDAAATLGASTITRWRSVILPLLRRPIAESVALGFLVSWAQVALTLLVGGGAVRTLPLDVLAMLQAGQDQRAAVGALALALPALAVIAAARVASRQSAAVAA